MIILIGAIISLAAVQMVWSYDPGGDARVILAQEQTRVASLTATEVPTVEMSVDVVQLVPTVTPVVVYETVQVVVTATPEPTPEPTYTPVIVYQNVPYEVTREIQVPVEVTREIVLVPTGVPVGYVNVCVHGEELVGIWVDGVGIAGGACRMVQLHSPDNDVHVQVKK